jgi:hypothetical protein
MFSGLKKLKTGGEKSVFSLDRRQSLAGIPALNEGVSCLEGANGDTLLSVMMRRRGDFLGRFQPARWERKVQLDSVGSFVLAQINGERSVLEITEILIARHKVNRREAELSTVAFLKSLLERNIISIGIP